MKSKLLMKSLLVAAGLCVGAMSSWAVTNTSTVTGIVGATDNSSGFNTIGNKAMPLAAGDEYVITFVNFNKGASGTDYWANWAFISDVFNCRADHGESNPYWGSATNVNYSGSSWKDISSTISEWLQAYDGVTVTLTVSRDVAGTGLTVAHTATTNAVGSIASQTYAGTFTATVGASDAINFYLTVENAHLNITNVVYTDASKNVTTYSSIYSNDFDTTGWTATGKKDGWTCNPGTTTANTFGSKVIGVGAGSGDMGLVSPSLSISNSVNIVDVAMKFKLDACTSGKSSGIDFVTSDVNVNSGYVSSGTPFFSINGSANGNGYWGTISVGGDNLTSTLNQASITYENNSLNRNSTGILILYVRFNFSTKTATYTLYNTSGTTLISSNTVAFANSSATTLDRVFLHAGKTYGGVTIDDIEVCSIVSDVAETTYFALFNESNSLSPTVTIYTDSERTDVISNGSLKDGETYYYTATLTHYYDYQGSFTVNGNNPTVNFEMTAVPLYNYSVNAIDGENGIIKAGIVSGTCYADESTSFYLPACVLVDGKLYFTTAESSYKSETVSSNNQVFSYAYTEGVVDNVVFFVEGEDISGANESTPTGNQRLASKGHMGRGSKLNVTSLPAGAYTVYVKYINTNSGAHTLIVKAGETDVINATDVTVRPTKSGNVTLTETTNITLTAAASSISGVDYLYIVKTGETTTVSTVGYSTLASDYDLDFSSLSSSLIAYKATIIGTKITFKAVDKVPAGEGVLLRSVANLTKSTNFVIPVTTGVEAWAAEDNAFVRGTNTAVATSGGGYYNYVLSTLYGVPGFYQAGGKTVPDNKAYLQSTTNAARISLIFDEANGIEAIEGGVQRTDNDVYNMNGQRVAAPTKGLYIMNGKKVIYK